MIKIFAGNTTKCPQCGNNTLWHNKGVSRAGNPWENEKCNCGYIKWLTDNYYTAKEKAEQPEDEKKLDYALDEMTTKQDERDNHDCHLSPEDGCDCQLL